MTTNATPPAETAKETPNPSPTDSVKTVPSTPEGTKPLLGSDRLKQPEPTKTTPPVEKKDTPPAELKKDDAPVEKVKFHREKFADYELVRMYLKQEGCVQYDPAFPELVLNTSDKRGMLLPLTPFFKSRIGVTLELVL